MKKVFLDTNVLLDFLMKREPFFKCANSIIRMLENNMISGQISALSFGQIYYFYRKKNGHKFAIDHIKALLKLMDVCSLTKDSISLALDSRFLDFEDAMQYFSAVSIEAPDFIITRNVKDFKYSEVPVFTPETFLSYFDSLG